MKFRVYFGAIISLLDIYTDIEAIVRFFDEGNDHYAYANIAFVGVSLSIQLLVVFVQNKKRGWKILIYESMIVISMLKPAIDAKRVLVLYKKRILSSILNEKPRRQSAPRCLENRFLLVCCRHMH